MQLTDETPVKIVNNASLRHVVPIRPNTAYGKSTIYVLEPNSTAFWTWRVAKHWLGDPGRQTDQQSYRIELRRARSHFGQASGDFTQPDVEVHTMEGQRIRMAIELGETGVPDNITTGISPDDMKSRMAALQAEMELLQSNLSGDLPPTEALTPNDPDAGTDTNLTSLTDLPADDSVTPGRRSGTLRNTPLRPAPATLTADLPE